MKEIWKKIEEYNNYMISNFGRVKSLYSPKGKNLILKAVKDKDGYFEVCLYSNSKTHKNKKIHRLVGKYFVDNPYNKPQINHKDSNRLNNHFSNLEWCTHKENHKHCDLYGFRPKGEQNGQSKLNQFQIKRIRLMKEITPKLSSREIAKIFNMGKTAIKEIIRGRTWKHLL